MRKGQVREDAEGDGTVDDESLTFEDIRFDIEADRAGSTLFSASRP